MAAADPTLPDGWEMRPLPEVAQINPRLGRRIVDDRVPVTFVPMRAVAVEGGGVVEPETRPYGEVRKGYTAFLPGDVIMAKITPCMENGKIAVVPQFPNDICFGSTEFHVIRPNKGVSSRWIMGILMQRSVRKEAERHMSGAVGQMRVPIEFLKNLQVPIAPESEQNDVVNDLYNLLSDLDAGASTLHAVGKKLNLYRASVLRSSMSGQLTAKWRRERGIAGHAGNGIPATWTHVRLGEIVRRRGRTTDPRSVPTTRFLRMDHVEPHTTRLLGSVQSASMKSVANVFEAGDVLYGRLRPYLNKVYLAEFSGLCSSEFIVIPENSRISGRFLKYRLNSSDFVRYANAIDTGDRPRVNFRQVSDFRFLLPPVEEQIRIADIIDDILSDMDVVVGGIAQIARIHPLRQAILEHAFSGGLTPQVRGNERNSVVSRRMSSKRQAHTGGAPTGKGAGRLRRGRVGDFRRPRKTGPRDAP